MRKILLSFAAFALIVVIGQNARADEEFPEKGWHKGSYIVVTGGMMQATDDTNIQTNRKFDGTFIPAVGLTYGYDFLDSLGMMFQITFGGFTSAGVGDGTATYPNETGKEHVINLSLAARYTFLTGWQGQPSGVKILPYVKLGGTGRALYIHTPTDNNKVGAYGGGVAVGAGLEFFVWKGLFFAIDATEHLMFMMDHFRTINGTNTKIIDGGFKPNFQLLGMIGYHF